MELDDVGSLDWLQHFAEEFASRIDWQTILAGTDTTYRVTDQTTLWPQYSKR